MKNFLRQSPTNKASESGFVLVLSLVILLMLSLFGAWALQTSNFELGVAGGLQQAEKQFNISEGAANTEAANLGFVRRTFYQISDPTKYGSILTPNPNTEMSSKFDQGGDITDAADVTEIKSKYTANDLDTIKSDPLYWPWRNLWPVDDDHDTWVTADELEKKDTTHNDLDYRYLVTYLYPTTAPIGYDSSLFSGYKFRIQGNTARTTSIVELGGTKVGVKMSL